jgi:hypothetical protein
MTHQEIEQMVGEMRAMKIPGQFINLFVKEATGVLPTRLSVQSSPFPEAFPSMFASRMPQIQTAEYPSKFHLDWA